MYPTRNINKVILQCASNFKSTRDLSSNNYSSTDNNLQTVIYYNFRY